MKDEKESRAFASLSKQHMSTDDDFDIYNIFPWQQFIQEVLQVLDIFLNNKNIKKPGTVLLSVSI